MNGDTVLAGNLETFSSRIQGPSDSLEHKNSLALSYYTRLWSGWRLSSGITLLWSNILWISIVSCLICMVLSLARYNGFTLVCLWIPWIFCWILFCPPWRCLLKVWLILLVIIYSVEVGLCLWTRYQWIHLSGIFLLFFLGVIWVFPRKLAWCYTCKVINTYFLSKLLS